MSLTTRREIYRRQWNRMMINGEVIARIEQIAVNEKRPVVRETENDIVNTRQTIDQSEVTAVYEPHK